MYLRVALNTTSITTLTITGNAEVRNVTWKWLLHIQPQFASYCELVQQKKQGNSAYRSGKIATKKKLQLSFNKLVYRKFKCP